MVKILPMFGLKYCLFSMLLLCPFKEVGSSSAEIQLFDAATDKEWMASPNYSTDSLTGKSVSTRFSLFPRGKDKKGPIYAQLAEKKDTQMEAKLILSSPSIAQNEKIPRHFTGEGDDISPALSWSNVPTGTKELAIICDDPDASPTQPWVHWVIYKIPAMLSALPEAVRNSASPANVTSAVQGVNSWGTLGYRGPQPPKGSGKHHYRFSIYALNTPIPLPPGVTKETLLQAMQGHIIAKGELVGTYER